MMTMTEKILNAKYAGDIFKSRDVIAIRAEYKRIAKQIHPDVNDSGLAEEAMRKLNSLYKSAKLCVLNNSWEETSVYYLYTINGKTFKMTYRKKYIFEFGTTYVGDMTLLYVFDKEYEKYYRNAVRMMNEIRYQNQELKKYFSMFMPVIREHGKMKNDKFYIALAKNRDVYPLREVWRYFSNEISNRHVAWMMTRINNLICFLKINGIVHNGITLDNLFVSPSHHGVCIYGGWWYSAKTHTKLIGMNKKVYNILPPSIKKDHIASHIIDIECVKAVGRELFNKYDKEGAGLYKWMNAPSKDDVFKNLDLWDKTLDDTYHERKFYPMTVREDEIYS